MKHFNKETMYSEFLIYFLDYERNFTKESTYAVYTGYVFKKIIPYLGGLKLKELNSKRIQDYCTYLTTKGNLKTGNGLSYKSTKDIMIYIKRSIEYLFKHNKVKTFDINYKIMCDNNKKSLEIFDDHEVIVLRDYLKANYDHRNIGILIAMYSGLRIGELCALKWEDIDLKQKVIVVNKTVQRISIIDNDLSSESKIIITTPKSQKSNRVIPINNEIYALLKANYNIGYVLCAANDVLIEPRKLRFHYTAILKKAGIKNRPFHSLRHTFATRIIKNTNDFKTVSELLGHSSISVTLDIYTHTSHETKISCINKF